MTGPLAGRTILLTRDGGLVDALRELGAEVRLAEVTRFVPLPARADPGAYDWIVYTSPRAVAYSPFPPDAGPRIACVGPSTAQAVRERGGRVDRMPVHHDAEALCEVLIRGEDMTRSRVLFPCSDRALYTVENRLAEAGAIVTRLPVYRTDAAVSLPAGVADGADVIVFLAPSGVEAFDRLGGDLTAAPVLAIGETTAAALRERGVAPEVASTSDRAGLIEALTNRRYSR